MPSDRLTAVLERAKRRAALRSSAADRLSVEHRLLERSRLRELLSDERMDGLRFRFYFSQIETSTPLDQLRAWIDSKIAKDAT